ncbi:MAG TPA: RNB domain-containing ribonuclease [Thermoanaerobaculia bacterium]|nr:RNB domain-containing ribonuclease [Thermoanaerobaculia bacterium]
MSESPARQRAHLRAIARQAMIDRDLEPDFPPAAMAELARIQGPARPPAPGGDHPGGKAGETIRDLRQLLWCSIDNDDSRDLDQLSVAEALGAGGDHPGGRAGEGGPGGGAIKVLVAVADVDAVVAKGSALDDHAGHNTTSVYTAAEIFPMLPERLSTDLTSLGEGEDRLAIVVEMVVEPDGSVSSSTVYRAWVRNQAKLAYNGVGAWIEGKGPAPPRLAAVPGLDRLARLQDAAAQRLRALRYQRGALALQTLQSRPVFSGDQLTGLELEVENRAKQLIEDFMIAANGATAQFLAAHGLPSVRRVVRTPKRWSRIVELAAARGEKLPADPDAAALSGFLERQRQKDSLRFPDLSLTVVKLLGSGEYVAEAPGGEAPGHFGLAVRDYTHSTAPNRRFPDVLTQRLLKAALAGRPSPYPLAQLTALATRCTEKEDDAQKVERRVHKSAAAMLLATHVGQSYDGVITGASDKGTWVRIFQPPVEGRLVHGFAGLDVGDKVHVRLALADVDRGFIDFVR